MQVTQISNVTQTPRKESERERRSVCGARFIQIVIRCKPIEESQKK